MTRPPDDVPEPGVDVEAEWAQIVAHWSDEAAGHALPANPIRVSDEDSEQLLDIADVSDPARISRPADATDGLNAAPSAPREQALGDDTTGARTGSEPFEYLDYLDHPDDPPRTSRHRLTPEEVAELADESWGADADRSTDDRRSTDDWRRSPSSPATSHVGGEEARSGSSASLEDDVEGFVPPDPPPLPRGDIVSRLAWIGALGAPLFLLVAALFWRTAPSMLVGAAVAAFVAGFVTLVVRMPDRSDDKDDGAVV